MEAAGLSQAVTDEKLAKLSHLNKSFLSSHWLPTYKPFFWYRKKLECIIRSTNFIHLNNQWALHYVRWRCAGPVNAEGCNRCSSNTMASWRSIVLLSCVTVALLHCCSALYADQVGCYCVNGIQGACAPLELMLFAVTCLLLVYIPPLSCYVSLFPTRTLFTWTLCFLLPADPIPD